MMSTLSDEDPLKKRMFGDRQEAHRKDAKDKINAMSKIASDGTSFMMKEEADRLMAAYEGYELSTNWDGDLIEQRADVELSTLWPNFLGTRYYKEAKMKKGSSTAPRPGKPKDRTKEQEAAADELIELAGGKVGK
jgi:hypothetical protein